MMRGPSIAVALVWLGIVPVHAETIHLTAVRDATLFEDIGGAIASGAGPTLFVGDNGSRITRRALVAFDVAASVPAGAHIDHVELRMFMSNSPDTLALQSIFLLRARASWGEGTSNSAGGTGAFATPGDATWKHRFFPDSLWAEEGGDFSTVNSAVFVVGRLGSYGCSSARMATDVQVWLDVPDSDFGWLLQGDEGTAGTARRFDTHEHPDPSHWPVLIVEFTPTSLSPSGWGQVKQRFRD